MIAQVLDILDGLLPPPQVVLALLLITDEIQETDKIKVYKHGQSFLLQPCNA